MCFLIYIPINYTHFSFHFSSLFISSLFLFVSYFIFFFLIKFPLKDFRSNWYPFSLYQNELGVITCSYNNHSLVEH